MKIKCQSIDFSDILIKEASVVKIPLVHDEIRNCQRRGLIWTWKRRYCE